MRNGIDRDMGAKHAQRFVKSAETTGWLRGTELGELIQPIEQRGRDGDDVPRAATRRWTAWQSKLEKATGRKLGMPIIHKSQLIGVAADFEESEFRFKRHVVSVQQVVTRLST